MITIITFRGQLRHKVGRLTLAFVRYKRGVRFAACHSHTVKAESNTSQHLLARYERLKSSPSVRNSNLTERGGWRENDGKRSGGLPASPRSKTSPGGSIDAHAWWTNLERGFPWIPHRHCFGWLVFATYFCQATR